jgi:hypothetical protein
LNHGGDKQRVGTEVRAMRTRNRGAESANKPYVPTVRDIRRECERIQATWSPRERDKRAGRTPLGSWEPPNIRLAIVSETGDEDEGSWATVQTAGMERI